MPQQLTVPVSSSAATRPHFSPPHTAPLKIYYLDTRLAGPISEWKAHFARAKKMGFDHICLPPLFAPGPDGDLFLTGQHDRPDPALGIEGSTETAVRAIAFLAKATGLHLLADIVLDRVAVEGETALLFPDLFGEPERIGQIIDPRQPPSFYHAAPARFEETRTVAEWWGERLGALAKAGLTGFRLLGLQHVPVEALRDLIAATRREAPTCRFLAWTPGLPWQSLPSFAGIGLDGVFASTPWWDTHSDWYVEEHNALISIAPVIGLAEAPFDERIAPRLQSTGQRIALYRRTLAIAAATGSGLMVPMGFEFMTRRAMNAHFGDPADFTEMQSAAEHDFAKEITAANALVDQLGQRGATGRLRALTGAGSRVTILKSKTLGVALCINSDLKHSHPLPVALAADETSTAPLEPAEVRLVPLTSQPPIIEPAGHSPAALESATASARIVIDNITPRVEGGPFAAKRIVGETMTVEADIFVDGHDILRAELLWKAADATSWTRTPMTPLPNDRWRAVMTPHRVGRWHFSVEAWIDELATVRHALKLKQDAKVDVSVELAEEQALLKAGAHRSFIARAEPLPLDVERTAAGFASWYELFPRSITSDPKRHGTLADVMGALPRVSAMGFDVLYFPPIHPIGNTARKGRNNALKAEPDDVGSPYAIGSIEGGHDALHPALGTLDDFRRLVAAARDNGLELALDFAIQCSPDHPWLKQHPEWFRHRPDGTIKHAENPPKKYEDIVNVDFYAPGAVPSLWAALRDVVLFWIGEGVKIFRVDNPHTKPLPFWQWLIADIRGRHPDAMFLAEAFTKPKMMYRLGKVGFSQSYTYFTWRNTKQELIAYLTELAAPPVADFYRPHFFVNTPDINPIFLQTSGRAGFLIRAALAATMSGLWGVYSGFELCESAALADREEYLDSEKYEIRVRDFEAPGNIVSEIATLNRLRRAHPALQSHRGIKFYNADNDKMLVYGKQVAGRDDMILIAISLDPHNAQETAFELPLWEWKLPDSGALAAEDLITGHRFTWAGKGQRVRLDPQVLPYALWRLAPIEE